LIKAWLPLLEAAAKNERSLGRSAVDIGSSHGDDGKRLGNGPVAGMRPKLRRGPKPGTLNRYVDSDRALFPEMQRLMRDHQLSATAAARRLAEDGKVAGVGGSESRARRLVDRFNKSDRNHP
jgi:hypothetical protein